MGGARIRSRQKASKSNSQAIIESGSVKMDSIREKIQNKLATKGYTALYMLPNDRALPRWERLQQLCKLTDPELDHLMNIIFPVGKPLQRWYQVIANLQKVYLRIHRKYIAIENTFSLPFSYDDLNVFLFFSVTFRRLPMLTVDQQLLKSESTDWTWWKCLSL